MTLPRTVRKLTVTQSSSLPVVVSEHAAQAVSTVNPTATWKRCKLRPDNLVFERLMIAFGVIMNHELFNGPAQRSFAKQDHSIQAPLLDCAHIPLGVSTHS